MPELYEFRWINDSHHTFQVTGDRNAMEALVHHFENFICLPFRIIRLEDKAMMAPEHFDMPRMHMNYWVTSSKVTW